MELASPELNESTIKLSGTFPEKDGTSPTEGGRQGLVQRTRRTQRKRTENLLHHRDTEVTEELKSADYTDYADFVLGSD
jgi:hypothetical protein